MCRDSSVTLLKDLPTAYDLWRACGIRIGDADSLRECSWRNYFQKHPERFLAAYDHQQKLVGVAVLFFDGRKAGVYRVAVAPDHRRKGIGRTLIGRAETIARSLGAVSIYALVEQKSHESAGMFSREWFERMDGVNYYVKSLA